MAILFVCIILLEVLSRQSRTFWTRLQGNAVVLRVGGKLRFLPSPAWFPPFGKESSAELQEEKRLLYKALHEAARPCVM